MSCFDEVSPPPFCKSIRLALAPLLFEAMVGIIGLHHDMMNFTRIARAQIVHRLSCAAVYNSREQRPPAVLAPRLPSHLLLSQSRPEGLCSSQSHISAHPKVCAGGPRRGRRLPHVCDYKFGPFLRTDCRSGRCSITHAKCCRWSSPIGCPALFVWDRCRHPPHQQAPWNACYSFGSMTSSPLKSSSFWVSAVQNKLYMKPPGFWSWYVICRLLATSLHSGLFCPWTSSSSLCPSPKAKSASWHSCSSWLPRCKPGISNTAWHWRLRSSSSQQKAWRSLWTSWKWSLCHLWPWALLRTASKVNRWKYWTRRHVDAS